jgi:hypothetical protein
MRPQAHTAASLLIWSSAPGAPWWEAPVDTIAGNLPDFDRNVAERLGVKGRTHHRWVSHSAVGWLPLTLLLGGRRWARRPLACIWVHLLLDTYADGIVWLWPVHREKIGLFRKPPEIRDNGWKTPAPLSTNMGRAELGMWAGIVLNLLRRAR